MAKATKETKITVPAVQEVKETTVTLVLTENEAWKLLDFLSAAQYSVAKKAGVFDIYGELNYELHGEQY